MDLSFLRTLACLSLCLLAVRPAGAQIAYWQQYLGGSGFDKGKKLLLQPDGTLILAGETTSRDRLGKASQGGSEVAVVKYASQGIILWQATLGGSGDEMLGDLIQLPDEGFLLTGSTTSADSGSGRGGSDVWAVRLDRNGETRWSRRFGGSGDDRGLAALALRDGSFLIGGESASANGDMASPRHGGLESWIAKISSDGRLLWEQHYGGRGNEKTTHLVELEAGRYLAVNTSDSRDGDVRSNLGVKDVWMFVFDDRGAIQWQQSYGGADNEEVHSILRDAEGNLVLAGTTFSPQGGMIPLQRGKGDAWLFKLAPDGTVLWSITYGGPRPEGFSSLAACQDGGFVAAGVTESRSGEGDIEYNAGYLDGWIVKVNAFGERIWSRAIGYTGKDLFESITEAPDGGFLALGASVQDLQNVRPPGLGGHTEWWIANLSDPKRPGVRPFVTPPVLYGTVQDRSSGKPLQASVTLIDNSTLDTLDATVSAADDGSFAILLPAYGLISVSILAPGYLFYGFDIRMDTVIRRTTLEHQAGLELVRIGSKLILKNIYFDAGKWDLLPESNAELERIVAFMALNPRVQIQVSGHTDNTGDKNEKIALSLNRANAVRAYLLRRSVAENRMKVKGYGMYRPLAPNTTPEGRQRNRRVEFEVINL